MAVKESDFQRQTSIGAGDLVRIVSNGASRNIDGQNLADSILQLGTLGANLRKYTTVNGNYILGTTDDIVAIDTSTGDATATLPDPTVVVQASGTSPVYTIKKSDSSTNTLIVTSAGTAMIEGQMSIQLIGTERPYVSLVSDGQNWLIIGA